MAKAGDTGVVYVEGDMAYKIGKRGFERLNEEFRLQKQVYEQWQSTALKVPGVGMMKAMASEIKGLNLSTIPSDDWQLPAFSMERISALSGDPWLALVQQMEARGKSPPMNPCMVRVCLNWAREIEAYAEEIEIGAEIVERLVQPPIKLVVEEVAKFISYLHFEIKVDAQDFELYICGPDARLVAVLDFSDMDLMLPPLTGARIVEAARALEELQDVIPRPGSKWYRAFRYHYISRSKQTRRDSDANRILKVFDKSCAEMGDD